MEQLKKIQQEKNLRAQVDTLQRLLQELEKRVIDLETFIREDMEFVDSQEGSSDDSYCPPQPLKKQKTY